jgi:hypothetical protein
MTSTFKSIESNALAIDAAEMMEKYKIFSLVVNSSTHKKIPLVLLQCINFLKRE